MLFTEKHSDVIVFTSIFGDIKDELRPPPETSSSDPKIEFVAFLDESKVRERSGSGYNGWKVRQPFFIMNESRRQARAHKILAHKIFPSCKYYLWIDGCLQLAHSDVRELIKKNLRSSDVCVFKHKKRSCVYEELQACIDQDKDDPEVMRRQVNKYHDEGYPANNGLAETTAILRRNNKETRTFNEFWWSQINNGSHRDQLSFDYSMWKLKMKYSNFPRTCTNSEYFKWFRH